VFLGVVEASNEVHDPEGRDGDEENAQRNPGASLTVVGHEEVGEKGRYPGGNPPSKLAQRIALDQEIVDLGLGCLRGFLGFFGRFRFSSLLLGLVPERRRRSYGTIPYLSPLDWIRRRRIRRWGIRWTIRRRFGGSVTHRRIHLWSASRSR
jgi:hypothetical protein